MTEPAIKRGRGQPRKAVTLTQAEIDARHRAKLARQGLTMVRGAISAAAKMQLERLMDSGSYRNVGEALDCALLEMAKNNSDK